MKTPLSKTERVERMCENAARFDIPRLRWAMDLDLTVAICGYGPSLADTWRDVIKADSVISTSGAHDFLIANGIVPTYHVECDPRAYKADFLRHPHEDVVYLINSQCHSDVFDALNGFQVVMWHGFTDDDADAQIQAVTMIEPDARFLAGGTNVGLRAIVVARELGFKSYELHGMDCCYFGEKQWAGDHLGQKHRTVAINVEGREFSTSDLMMVATDDFFNMLGSLGGCSFRIHGDGLLATRMKMFMEDREKALGVNWWEPVDFARHPAWMTGKELKVLWKLSSENCGY